jgi:hypothetical protein
LIVVVLALVIATMVAPYRRSMGLGGLGGDFQEHRHRRWSDGGKSAALLQELATVIVGSRRD